MKKFRLFRKNIVLCVRTLKRTELEDLAIFALERWCREEWGEHSVSGYVRLSVLFTHAYKHNTLLCALKSNELDDVQQAGRQVYQKTVSLSANSAFRITIIFKTRRAGCSRFSVCAGRKPVDEIVIYGLFFFSTCIYIHTYVYIYISPYVCMYVFFNFQFDNIRFSREPVPLR